MIQGTDAVYPIKSTFEFYEEVPDLVDLGISCSDVEMVTWLLGCADVLGGAGVNPLKEGCTQLYS